MNDQASTLRTMTNVAPPISHLPVGAPQTANTAVRPLTAKNTQCLAITGGKGGVGKSNLSVNLALELGALGSRVMLLDADFGLGNADLLCGITPKYHLGHVISGIVELEDIQTNLAQNVCLLPSGSGIEELSDFSLTDNSSLITKLRMLEETQDFMLIDTAAGIAKNVSGILASATEVVIVTTPEPTAVVDAYATIKVVLRRSPNKTISVVVNNVVGISDAEQVFAQISAAVKGFLNRQINYLGMIPHDAQVAEAVRRQMPLVFYAPQSPAARAIRLLARQLNTRKMQKVGSAASDSFWNSLSEG